MTTAGAPVRGAWLRIGANSEPFEPLSNTTARLPWPQRGDVLALPGSRVLAVRLVTFHYGPEGLSGVTFTCDPVQ